MKKHSCGAIFYTIYKNNIYIILGKEKGDWFPFKGTNEKDETYKETAVREIMEETCTLINLDKNDISLDCNFSTSRKYYHIGLIPVHHSIISKFYKIRQTLILSKFLEKTDVKMFSLNDIFKNNFHQITQTPILFYWSYLKDLQEKLKMSKNKEILADFKHKTSIINKA